MPKPLPYLFLPVLFKDFLKIRAALLLAFLALAVISAWAQAPAAPADCLIKTLGLPAGDSAVVQIFQDLGLTPPNQAEGAYNVRQGVRVALSGQGTIESIAFMNDSVRSGDRAYRGYKGPLPFGLTFADSLGIEENALFNQEAANTVSNETGYDGVSRFIVGLKAESGTQAYRMDIYFTPAREYFQLKAVRPRIEGLKRTYWYRFRRETYPLHGKYLELPLLCDGTSGGYTPRERYSRADSAYSLNVEVNVLPLGRGFLKEDLETGAGFGLIVRAPLSRRFSPPVHQQFGLSFGSHTYSAYKGQDNTISLSTTSLFYGLYVQPRRGFLKSGAGQFHPYLDVRLYGDLFNTDKVTNASQNDLKPSNLSWGSQGGAGIMFEGRKLQGGAGVHYRFSRQAKYLHLLIDQGQVYDAVVAKSVYHALAIQFWIGIKFLGS